MSSKSTDTEKSSTPKKSSFSAGGSFLCTGDEAALVGVQFQIFLSFIQEKLGVEVTSFSCNTYFNKQREQKENLKFKKHDSSYTPLEVHQGKKFGE